MVSVEDTLKVGDKYYLATDVQQILEQRIEPLSIEDIEGL